MNMTRQHDDEVQQREEGQPAEKSHAQAVPRRRNIRGEQAQRDATTTAPESPGQPAAGE